MSKIKKESPNRTFGIVFAIVFLIIAFWTFRGNFEDIKKIPLFISLVFLVLGLLNSKLLTPLNKIWLKLGEKIGKVIAPIVMGIVYFLVLTPISLLIRMLGKDLLKIKFSQANSYWIEREKDITSMKKQF
tara:strand:- start:104 stop:493 length:390 start_codon:yes stop_codon:yes gene_type:complete